jgi:ubiquinone/menaquinone biosynthesis C-methylase UbiE
VWEDKSHINYARLRLFKAVDKIKKISSLGIDFKDKDVADIGCGNGTVMMYLQKYFNIKGVGIDISEHVIHELQSNLKNKSLSFMVGDHRDLRNIPNDRFDIVLSFGVIEHFEEYGQALAEARRILRPGGKLVLIQPNLFSFGVIQEYYLRSKGTWKFGKQKDFSLFYYKSLLRHMGYKSIIYMTAPPYSDMGISKFFDIVIKKMIPFWGHYLYLIAEK